MLLRLLRACPAQAQVICDPAGNTSLARGWWLRVGGRSVSVQDNGRALSMEFPQ